MMQRPLSEIRFKVAQVWAETTLVGRDFKVCPLSAGPKPNKPHIVARNSAIRR